MSNVAIIGAGLGGLSAAIRLSVQGHNVRIFEAAEKAGGKAGEVCIDGVRADTGPSVLTMPDVLRDLLASGGWVLEEHLELLEPTPAFRYLYPSGESLDIFPRLEESAESVAQTFGSDAKQEFLSFLNYSKTIWDISAPQFIFGPAPTWAKMIQMGIQQLGVIHKVDPLRSMKRAIAQYVKTPELRWLFWRYATYNGSDMRVAPATLNCIAHVELALGGFGIKGGIYELIRCLTRLAEHHGVEICYNSPVEQILTKGKHVYGLQVNGHPHTCDLVIANADAAHISRDLLPQRQAKLVRPPDPVSMSGWTGVFRAKHQKSLQRVAHTVLFPQNYEDEFRDIFDLGRPPNDPTVYLCAQSQCHQRAGWSDSEAVFAMINTPPEPKDHATEATVWENVQENITNRLKTAGLMHDNDRFVWTRTPTELASQFPGSRGAIYGASSNTRTAAFTRPPNRTRNISGLYLASGSAHPGGGMPLAMLSGKAAAEAVMDDT